MTHLETIIALQNMPFKEKVEAAIKAAPINEEQAAEWLADLVFAEQTKGLLGEAAFAILEYDETKDWLRTLFVTAISVVLHRREKTALDIEGFFLEAWLNSPSTRALSDWFALSMQAGNRIAILQNCQLYLAPIIAAGAASAESRTLLRMALMRHVLLMAETHPLLLVEAGLFAKLA
ncbi:MAG: hypothetical protein K2Y39_06025 [Candidatus Obscuribacterales bacterium]|nr:hypothetical protein [Candidatus Obscuribacterales bacterium]